MRKTLIVARWEFLTTVTRRSYILMVIGLPLFFGLATAIPVLSGRSAAQGTQGEPVAIVDPANLVDVGVAMDAAVLREAARAGTTAGAALPRLLHFTDLAAALTELRARKVSAVYALEADYLATGLVRTYAFDAGIFGQLSGTQRQGQVADAIRASLVRPHLSDDGLTRAYAPLAQIERLSVTQDGEVAPAAAPGFGRIGGAMGVIMLLTISIFISAGLLQQATVEDRQNRVIEILMSSITADQLLLGKIIGLGAAGLLQVLIYVLLVIVPAASLLSVIDVPIANVFTALVYYPLGYLLFAALMAGTGMMGRTPQEAGQLSAVWTITAAAPLWFFPVLTQSSNGLTARALSFFPLTMPVTMMIRSANGNVPLMDYIISIAVGVVSIYFTMKGAAKIFRTGILMTGKRVTLPEVIRWLRAA